MKKTFYTIITLLLMGGLKAQSLAEARKLLYYERYDGAAHQLQILLKTEPVNSEAWWLLTRIYLHNGELNKIEDSLQKIPASAADQPFVLCAKGSVSLAQGRKDSASNFFQRALSITKEKIPSILSAIAMAHQNADSGNNLYAIELLNKAIKRDKRNPELYVQLGDAYRKLQDGGSAFKAYQEALSQDGRYARAFFKTGKIFLTQNNQEQYLKYFNDAVAADSQYAPAWFELYYHSYYRDVNKAKEYLDHYIANSDPGIRNDYLVTDLLYNTKNYGEAIQHAQNLIEQLPDSSEPRLYKLIAYCYTEQHDSLKALDYMRQYFHHQKDTGFVPKDFETLGEIYAKLDQSDSAVSYYTQAWTFQKDSTIRRTLAKKLADLHKKQKDFSKQAYWLGEYFQGNGKATNLDLFNWGLAHYMAKEYLLSDSVFGIYETKYPDQDFGYYWRARSDAAIDTSMQTGMAIPHYLKVIEIDHVDSTNKTNRKHLIEAYGYIAAYKANTQKDFSGSIEHFEKLLELDPGNSDARKYISILQKNQQNAEKKATAKAMPKEEKEDDGKSIENSENTTKTKN